MSVRYASVSPVWKTTFDIYLFIYLLAIVAVNYYLYIDTKSTLKFEILRVLVTFKQIIIANPWVARAQLYQLSLVDAFAVVLFRANAQENFQTPLTIIYYGILLHAKVWTV